MQTHYNYLKSKNMTHKTKILKRTLLTDIRNYKRRYTIYMMVCNITGDTYYGSTCVTLKRRLYCHKYNLTCSSKSIIDRNDYLPLIPLETNLSYSEKKEREDWYITNNACVNIRSAKFTVERRKKTDAKWNNNNKKYIKQYNYWTRTSPIGILSRAYF
tara:strand:+ start:98 stop:571 length:474 start_codon:yes stop_codon:yes gene_type:complete